MLMKKIFVVAVLLLAALSGSAQEKVMTVQKKDGTSADTRVADVKEISFLAVEAGSQGVLVKTQSGETAAVRFEANPVVTVANGKLNVRSSDADAMVFEISDVAEILFGDASEGMAIKAPEGLAFVVQEGGALLRGIPKGVKPRIYTMDGRCLPTPPLQGDELRLNRATLGAGIFIVKVGSFATKIRVGRDER